MFSQSFKSIWAQVSKPVGDLILTLLDGPAFSLGSTLSANTAWPGLLSGPLLVQVSVSSRTEQKRLGKGGGKGGATGPSQPSVWQNSYQGVWEYKVYPGRKEKPWPIAARFTVSGGQVGVYLPYRYTCHTECCLPIWGPPPHIQGSSISRIRTQLSPSLSKAASFLFCFVFK